MPTISGWFTYPNIIWRQVSTNTCIKHVDIICCITNRKIREYVFRCNRNVHLRELATGGFQFTTNFWFTRLLNSRATDWNSLGIGNLFHISLNCKLQKLYCSICSFSNIWLSECYWPKSMSIYKKFSSHQYKYELSEDFKSLLVSIPLRLI